MRSIHFTLALVGAVAALPQNPDPSAEDPGLPTAQGVHRVYISKSCTEDEKKQISESFDDAKKLANALMSWEPNGKNQDAMNVYMGTFADNYALEDR